MPPQIWWTYVDTPHGLLIRRSLSPFWIVSIQPQQAPTHSSRAPQESVCSTVWQVDTWGLSLFWKNLCRKSAGLRHCVLSFLCIIPPKWCRNCSYNIVEDCSLIWCDSSQYICAQITITVLDSKKDRIAILEANKMKIPVISIPVVLDKAVAEVSK